MPRSHPDLQSHGRRRAPAGSGSRALCDAKHIFQNIGDGTYYHCGLLAIRAACGGRVNITYKILFNDAVAMTGGQPVDGTSTVPRSFAQVQPKA